VEKEYFDAKFEGLEKLMASQQAHLREYIVSVSTNVHRLEADLSAHKGTCPAGVRAREVGDALKEHAESIDAHGHNATNRFSSTAVAWLGVALASILAFFEFKRHP
jgi:hypothetical protein